jgi:hypothetical protein
MLVIALCLVGAVAGCTKTFHGGAVQPNPLVDPTETLRDSEVIVILTGDMELRVPRPAEDAQIAVMSTKPYKLENAATFTVVSRDRLRFHVQLEHKWQDWADPGTWEVYLIDDKGRRYEPESVQRARPKHLVTMWDQEVRSVQRDAFGNITEINDDGWKRRAPLGSLSVFRGRADFEFYQRDIFSEDVKSLTLVVKRKGVGFEFRWDFADSMVASGAD